jgi:hypothetical protein
MNLLASSQAVSGSRVTQPAQLATTAEILAVYAGILFYIWRWQYTHPASWVLLWAVVLVSHVAHRDTLRDMGFGVAELRASAQVVLPLALILFTPLVIYGVLAHRLLAIEPTVHAWLSLGGYALWCVAQQYLTQSYFHRRLMKVIRSPLLCSATVGLMFGGAHIPNPVLMVATTLGGFIFAEVFRRHPNIWPLALAQAVGGFLIAAVTPAALIHNMRVGPGYFFYGIR